MDHILALCQIFTNNGHQCFMVGGAVRDQILRKKVFDYDFAVSASVEEMMSLLSSHNYKVIPTGIKHGTVTLLMGGSHFELTTFRGKNLEEDSSKRDFTVNAIYYDPLTNKYFDPQKGKDDLEQKILRFVGKPRDRLEEDGLRTLRLFRFISTLDFEVEKNSLKEAKAKICDSLDAVSVERLHDELIKLLEGKAFYKIVISYPEVLTCLLPHLEIANDLINLPENRPLLRLASFYHSFQDSDFLRLKFSLKDMKYVSFIVNEQNNLSRTLNRKEVRRLLIRAQEAFSHEARLVLEDLLLLSLRRGYQCDELAEELQKEAWDYKSPLDGGELQKLLGLNQGKMIGILKDFLLDQVLEGKLASRDKEEARKIIMDYLKKS
mgnify:CR=1 FL=1